MDSNSKVVALGHAIVDVLAPSEDDLVAKFGLVKGSMTLIDDDQAEVIYSALGSATEASGGSAANTAACLASFGGDADFIGRVRDDGLGHVFAHDIRAAGVGFDVRVASAGPGTGRCLIMVTPDAERTMCTNLGAGGLLGADDVDAELIRSARVLYLEGFMCGKTETTDAVEKAVSAAKGGGTLVSLSASDPFWVDSHRPEMVSMLDRVDLLFANEQEACVLAGVDEVAEAFRSLADRCPSVAVTLGAAGSQVSLLGEIVSVPAVPVAKLVDTTGAGDSYAAGFLHGLVQGGRAERCARLGALAASEVISHIGARPFTPLSRLAAAAGLA